MEKKYKQWLLVPLILITGMVVNKVLSNQKHEMKRKPKGNHQKMVSLITVKNTDIRVPIRLTGLLNAYNKAEIHAEVSGVLLETPKRLKTGYFYRKGDVLALIDDRVFKNNVWSQKSELLNQITKLIPDLAIDYPQSADIWKSYLRDFQLDTPMAPLPETANSTERYYIASRNLYTRFYAVRSMEETLAKYRIIAPFDGVVTDAKINPGTLIRTGTRIATLTGSGHFEMEAFARPKQAMRLKIGQKAILKSEDMAGEFMAKITRINNVIDASQTIRVFLETSDKRLRDGLYLSAEITIEPVKAAIRLPKTLLVKGNNIFAVVNGTLELVPVKIRAKDGDFIIVQGLANGSKILSERFSGARAGMKLPVPDKQQQPGAGRKGKQDQVTNLHKGKEAVK